MKQLDIIKEILGYVPCIDRTLNVEEFFKAPFFAWNHEYNIRNNSLYIRFYKHTAHFHIEYSLKEILYEKQN